eukprot:CAMPEP_0114230258 /NCGR_PEP_ID=MMETSP0058-20121206/3369_1 /TAXON_ID=36894 /ORGANISM="Pyramimonas parkeae, CCMP726" /LENGTH=53 /DNA_ID=CAMNT_0001341437 /DNA_START=1031 /DNA_END=1192 /DNA_ORIENTATION=+
MIRAREHMVMGGVRLAATGRAETTHLGNSGGVWRPASGHRIIIGDFDYLRINI